MCRKALKTFVADITGCKVGALTSLLAKETNFINEIFFKVFWMACLSEFNSNFQKLPLSAEFHSNGLQCCSQACPDSANSLKWICGIQAVNSL
jgi:hypothetical protein